MKFEDLSIESKILIDRAIESKVCADQCEKEMMESGESGWMVNIKFAEGQICGYLEAVGIIEGRPEIAVKDLFERRVKDLFDGKLKALTK